MRAKTKLVVLGTISMLLIFGSCVVRRWTKNYPAETTDITLTSHSTPSQTRGEAKTVLTQEKRYQEFNTSIEFTNETRFYDVPESLSLTEANITPYDGWTHYDNRNITSNPSFENKTDSRLDPADWEIQMNKNTTGPPNPRHGNYTISYYNNIMTDTAGVKKGTAVQYTLPIRGSFKRLQNFTMNCWIWSNKSTEEFEDTGDSYWYEGQMLFHFSTDEGGRRICYNSFAEDGIDIESGVEASNTVKTAFVDIGHNNPINADTWNRVHHNVLDHFQNNFSTPLEDINRINNVMIWPGSPPGGAFLYPVKYYWDDFHLNVTGWVNTGVLKENRSTLRLEYPVPGYNINGKLLQNKSAPLSVPITKETGNDTILINDTMDGTRRLAFDLETSLTTASVPGERKQGKLSYQFDAPAYGRYQLDQVTVNAPKPQTIILSEEGAQHQITEGEWNYSDGQVHIHDKAFIADYFSKRGSVESFEVQLAYEASITSTVNDKEGNPLGGVTATLEHLDTDTVYTEGTGEKGSANFFDVPSGEYVLTIRGHGLTTSKQFTVTPYQSLDITIDTTITAPYVLARSLRYTLVFLPILGVAPVVAIIRVIVGIYTGRSS